MQRLIGFAAGMTCAITLGFLAAGAMPTRMTGVPDESTPALTPFAEDSPAVEPAAEPSFAGGPPGWLFNMADAGPRRSRYSRDSYDPYAAAYPDYAEPAYDPQPQAVDAGAVPAALALEEPAELVAASAAQAAQDVREAEAGPAAVELAGSPQPDAASPAEPAPRIEVRQLAGARP